MIPQNWSVTLKYEPFGRRIYKSSSSGTSIYAFDGDLPEFLYQVQ